MRRKPWDAGAGPLLLSYDAFRTTGTFTPDDPGHRLSHSLAPPPSRVDLRNREDTTLRTVSGSPPRAALALLGNDQCATRVSDEAFGSSEPRILTVSSLIAPNAL